MKQSPHTRLTLLSVLFLFFVANVLYAQPTFKNKLPIPPLIDAKDGVIQLTIGQTKHKFNPGNPADTINGSAAQNGITTFSYNKKGEQDMTLLGPTLVWHKGDSVHIRVTNNLPSGNATGTDSTTTHWHGVELPAQADGGPHQGIPPGATWPVDIKVVDYASTMWYHPHYHNVTLEQVQMGLSGLIIVKEQGDILAPLIPHTYGVDDIPVILGDIGVGKEPNNNIYNLTLEKGKRPFNIVNGVNSPYVCIPRHLVRLRILNGSTRKGTYFGFSKSYNNPAGSLIQFKLIATDGGYTSKADTMRSILSGVGERYEVVIDLDDPSYKFGDTVYLSNLNKSMPGFVVGSPNQAPAPGSGGKDATLGNAFLALVITEDSAFPGYQPIDDFPSYTVAWERELADTLNDIARLRHKNLVGESNHEEKSFTIDGQTFIIDCINDTICVNTKEIWAIQNKTPVAHPFHIHKIQFRILTITDSMGRKLDLDARGLNGPKDDLLIHPGWTVRFMGNFSDYPSEIEAHNGYMYHCHILTHEDQEGGGMMHQFVVANKPECEEPGDPEMACVVHSSTKEPTRQVMLMYPNPTSGEFFLQANSEMPSHLRIFDIQGREISAMALPAFTGEHQVPTDGLPRGLFLVEWRTREGIVTGKLVLQ